MIKKSLYILMIVMLCSCISSAKSKNDEALKYQNGKCVVFYPDNQEIKEYAKSLCIDKNEDVVIDYELKSMGDFYLVSYPDGLSFYTEKDFSTIDIKVKKGLDILSNELRYQMKKENIDIAYTSDFVKNTYKDNIDIDNIEVKLNNDQLLFYFSDYDFEVAIPLSIAQQIVDRDFGLEQVKYIKRNYVNENRPMVALTFDDGPYKYVENTIYDLMEKYDARATFYYVGSRFSQSELDGALRGIELGCEYGSHTENHENLSKLNAYDAKAVVLEVSDYFYQKDNYQMKTYRPPYGSRNEEMEDIIDMTAVLWNVDSLDWKYRDEETTYSNVMEYVTENDVVLLHSLYESSADACRRIVPELIDRGYQLVTVSELMETLGVDSNVFGGK